MDEHERSTLEPDEAPQPRTERLMRLTLLALCLVGTLFGSPAAADTIPIEITSGQTDRPVNFSTGAILNLFGDQFSLTARLFNGQEFHPQPPYAAGTTIAVDAGWVGNDAPGVFTYQGQTMTADGFENSLLFEFLSQPFVVPPVDGSPVVNVPFTLIGGIFAPPG
jgi:hypothetical protein